MFAGSHLADRYELIERVAEGGMGEVWRARQIALEREVAIKVLHPLHRVSSPDLESRFRREAEIVGKISHRNVISIIDFGMTEKGDQFLVMPFLHGETLEARMKSNPPKLEELLRLVRDVLSGLAAIHDVGVVHRDLKPANVFLAQDADGIVPKLLDFGISRDEKRENGTMLTQDGTVMGTPHYMAPEQFESARTVDHRADLYSLGAILYEAVGGRTPYIGADAFAVFRATLETDPPKIDTLRKDVDANLAALVHKAIEKAPDERFQSARDMREAIDRVLAGEPLHGDAVAPKVTDDISTAPTALAPDSHHALEQIKVPPTKRKTWPWALGLVLAGAGATALVMFWPSESNDPTPTEPVVVETEDPVTEPEVEARFARVASSGSLRSLAMRYARLPLSVRESVAGFAPEGERWAMLATSENAPALAERLETDVEPTQTEPTLRPQLMHTTVRLAVRERANVDAEMRRSLPHDTLVVALYGEIHNDDESIETSTDVDGEMTFIVVSPSSSGWSAARFLETDDTCLPLPAGLVRSAPSGMAGALRRTHTLARTTLRVGGSTRTAYLAAGFTRSQTVVAIYAAEGLCRAGDAIATVRQPGALDEVFLTDRNGDDESMVVLSTSAGARMRRWEVWALAPSERSVWNRELPTAPNLDEREAASVFGSRERLLRRHDQYTLALREASGRTWFSWDGTGLVEAQAPRRRSNASNAGVAQED